MWPAHGSQIACWLCVADDAAYHREYRRRNPERLRLIAKRHFEKVQEVKRKAKDRPCEDCGVQYPWYVMQFDHTGADKTFTIGQSVVGIARLIEEIAKCEVVCANCHAERTHQRKQGLTSN